MKKEVAVICKAYENLFGAQIKKEIAKCENAYETDDVENSDESVDVAAEIKTLNNAIKGEEYFIANSQQHINQHKEELIKLDGYFQELLADEDCKLVWLIGVAKRIKRYFAAIAAEEKRIEEFETRIEYFKKELASYTDESEETVDVKNYVEDDGSNDDADEEDEVLTANYNVDDEEDDDDELIDEAEVITVEEKVIATAELEKKLAAVQAEIKIYKATITESETDLDTQQKAIMEYASKIYLAKHNAEKLRLAIMMQESMIEESEEEAAALEAEILNRKITESYIDSIVTAAAFNASIQAEEMAAANNAEPVTFELERFNDGEIVSGDVAEIETAVSEVPIVDEDAEDEYNSTLKQFNDEIANIKTQIKKLQEEIIIPLQKKLEESVKQRNLHIRAMEKWVQKKIPEVTLTEYIKLTSQHGTTTATLRKEDDCTNRLFVDGDSNGGFKISDYKKTLASYSTLKAFKAAVNGLAAAIERGDKKFTFPADK